MKIKAKAIAIRMICENHESVNHNGNDSSHGYALLNCDNASVSVDLLRNKNVTYYKHNMVKVSEPTDTNCRCFRAYPKISADCQRNAIFRDQFAPYPVPGLAIADQINSLVSEAYLLRGYLYTGDKSIKRTSPFSISDAKCVTDYPQITFEVCSNEGNKENNLNGEDKSNNNFFVIESCGDWVSKSVGMLNLSEAQFISMDDIFGRCALCEDDFVLFKDAMKKRYNEDIQSGYYKQKTQSASVSERGIMLPNAVVTHMTKYLLSRLLGYEVIKTKASMYATSVEIKVRNGENAASLFTSEEGWIRVDQELIDSLEVEVDSTYIEIPADEAEKSISARADRKALLNNIAKVRGDKKAEDEEKKGKKSK